MNGNKPPAGFASAFTRHVALHPRVAYYPYPEPLCPVLVRMVIDEILVGPNAAGNGVVTGELIARGAEDTEATVFDENDPPNANVAIWRLHDTPGNGAHPDVAELVWQMRPILAAQGIEPGEVAPNHVLIPAPTNFHDCPYGPPRRHDPIALPDSSPLQLTIAVIDSGYQDSGPIAGLVSAGYGDWFSDLSTIGKPKWGWRPESASAASGLNPLDQDGDGRLDALVGHANFVAGVIVQACPGAKVVVESHNGAFIEADSLNPAVPTEASVARSLWKHRDAAVINVGFAFPTLPDIPLTGSEIDPAGPPSWSLDIVFQSIADRPAHVVVAPAGNQGCTTPQYPAAFSLTYPNAVGVGSLAPDGTRSAFSNHGPWVSCCTEGEDVASTFIVGWSGETEEAELKGYPDAGKHPTQEFGGWASWQGTSFAAPKVAGLIGALTPGEGTPLDAWSQLQKGSPVGSTEIDMGHVLAGLVPQSPDL